MPGKIPFFQQKCHAHPQMRVKKRLTTTYEPAPSEMLIWTSENDAKNSTN